MNTMALKNFSCRILLIILMSVAIRSQALSQNTSSDMFFLSLPSSSHAMALGSVNASIIANEPLLVMDNPALFGQEHSKQLSLSYMNYLVNTNYAIAFYSQSWGKHKAWGIGLRSLRYGDIPHRDERNNNLGTYSAGDISLQGSLSYELSDYIRAGVSIKGLYSNIAQYNALGIAVDLGMNYYNQDKDLSLGVALLNAGAIIRGYNKEKTITPWDVRIGLSKRFSDTPFWYHITVYDIHRQTQKIREKKSFSAEVIRHLAIGVQFAPNNRFYFSMGYNPKLAQDMNDRDGTKFAGITAGAGFLSSRYRVSISAMSIDKSNYALMASFSWDFRRIY